MDKPDWKQIAPTLVPVLVAAGACAAIPGFSHAAGDPAGLANVTVNLGVGLAASGIFSLFRPERFRAGREYQQTLANHDIRRMVRDAWGEAALASLKAYCTAYEDRPLSIVTASPPPAFQKMIGRLKAADFVGGDVSVADIQTAIAVSRRALLQATKNDVDASAVHGQVGELERGLIDSVLEALNRRLDGESLPANLTEFLEGKDPNAPNSGLLSQLSIYVAFYLKTNPRAQTAVLHFSLQEVSDRQSEIAALCGRIYGSLGTTQKELLDRFADEQAKLSGRIEESLSKAFRAFVQPQLDAPFSQPGDSGEFRFTYRERRTALVGREMAMDALIQFLGAPRSGSWTVISGPAGSGKSRLAAELIAKVRNTASYDNGVPAGQWRAGFLRRSDAWLTSDVAKWKPDADTLVVLDYAAEVDAKVLSDLLCHLQGSGEDAQCRVRVILIDRLPPDGDLGLATRILRGNDRGAEIAANRWPLGAPRKEESVDSRLDFLALSPVAEESALRIVEDWARAPLKVDELERVRQAIERDAELGRPLFAALMGDAISHDGLPPGELNPVSVASGALERLFRRQPGELAGRIEETKALLAVATICQGVGEDDLFDDDTFLCRLTGIANISELEIEALKSCLRRFSAYAAGHFAQLEPDFLAGLFVLEWLWKAPTKKRKLERADLLMEFGWQHGRDPAAFVRRFVSDFVGRFRQLTSALARSEQESDRNVMEDLFSQVVLIGLHPGMEGQAGAATVEDAVYLSSRANQPRLARQFLDALEAAYSTSQRATDGLLLARAWFGYAISGDLPDEMKAQRAEALMRIETLRDRYDTAEIGLEEARALMNGTVVEPDPAKRVALADRIGLLRDRYDTAEIGLQEARALCNAMSGQEDAERRREFVERIRALVERFGTEELAAVYERAVGLL